MAMYDAELDANGGYDDGDGCILTDEERELWEMETQAAIDADFDARYEAMLEDDRAAEGRSIVAGIKRYCTNSPHYTGGSTTAPY